MDLISVEELREVAEHKNSRNLSLFMPSHKTGSGMMQDPIRLKNLLKQAEQMLRNQGERHIDDYLEPIQAKLQDTDFWQHMSNGLAIFHSGEMTRFYRLPVRFEEFITLNDRFHIKPLLPLFSVNGQFYILALSQNKIRFLRGTRNIITELELKDVPGSFEEFLKLDEYEKSQQFHTETSQAPGEVRRSAIFYGHEADDDEKKQLVRWFREINNVVVSMLDGKPLMLFALEYLHPLYKKANTYPRLLDNGVAANPESLKPAELHEKSWKVMEPWFRQMRERDSARFSELAGTGKTVASVEDALPHAAHGRVDVLFVTMNNHIWGRYDPESARAEISERRDNGVDDLLDLTSLYTVVNSGTVYVVDESQVPGGGPVAGVLRY